MRKEKKYKKAIKLTDKQLRYNLTEYEKRLNAYDNRTDDMYGYEGCGVYLSDGESCSGSVWAVMQELVKLPYDCDCCYEEECPKCAPYNRMRKTIIDERYM
jgi:hypothetical protein